MENFNTFIDHIKSIIATTPLPGVIAHNQLYPENRKTLPKGDINRAIPSAVLLLIYPDQFNIPTVVFMKRNSYKGHHSRQISFPGGKFEPTDTGFTQTAIRETKEEIGVSCKKENIIGKLSELYIPVSNFLIHPYIGYIEHTPIFIPDKQEVESLIEIQLEELLSLPIQKSFIKIRNENFEIPFFPLKGEVLWGATAMIVNELKNMISK